MRNHTSHCLSSPFPLFLPLCSLSLCSFSLSLSLSLFLSFFLSLSVSLPPPFPLGSPSRAAPPPSQGLGDDLSSWKVSDLHVYVYAEPWTRQFDDPEGMRNLVQPSDAADPAPLVARDAAARAALEREHSQVLRITISIFISRLSLYFALQSILPVALCTLMSLTCFFLGASRVSTRLELTFSLFLTLAAIQFVIGEELPKTSAVLPAQVLVLFSYSFLFAVAAESLVVYHVEIFPELRAQRRRRAAAREGARRDFSRAVSDSGRRLVTTISSLGRSGKAPPGSPFLQSRSSAAAAAAGSPGGAAAGNGARYCSKDADAAGGELSSAAAAAAAPVPPASSSSPSSTSATRRELRPLRSIRFSSDVELGSSAPSTRSRKGKGGGFEDHERGAGGPKAASSAAAAAAASVGGGDHDGGEHHEKRALSGRGRRPAGGAGGSGAEKDDADDADDADDDDWARDDRGRGAGRLSSAAAEEEAQAERDRFAYAAWWIDRASFWLLLVGYALAAGLIFSLSSALAPGECGQFAQQNLIAECRLARREAEARLRLGGGAAVG